MVDIGAAASAPEESAPVNLNYREIAERQSSACVLRMYGRGQDVRSL